MRKRWYAAILLLLSGILGGCRSDSLFQAENISIDVTEVSTQLPRSIASGDGYVMEIRSTMSESSSMYVTFGLTAPEGMDLSPLLDLGRKEHLSFGNLLAIPSATNVPANVYHQVTDDGDGKNNTVNVIFQIAPVIPDGCEPAFGPGKTCSLSFDVIQKRVESQPHTFLAGGEWQFEIEMLSTEQEPIELLREPVVIVSEVTRLGEDPYALPPISDETVTVTSILLGPSAMQISFEKPEPEDTFDCLFMGDDVFLQMHDGRKIRFFQYEGASETAKLQSDQPILLKDAASLQFSDGTQVAIPG